MTVRAKFRVTRKEEYPSSAGLGYKISLSPVTDGSEENKRFFSYTPGGAIVMETVNGDAAGELAVGKEYYIDFTPAVQAAASRAAA